MQRRIIRRQRSIVELDKSNLLKSAFFVAVILLLGNAYVMHRDYQDSWILEGLEIPFMMFVTIYLFAFFSEKKVPWMVALAVIGRSVFLLVPNLKYVWFQGTAIDQHSQYALAKQVYSEGYITTQERPFNVLVYSRTPLFHLTFAMFSVVLNVSVLDSFKYVPILMSSMYPLLTYIMIKNSSLQNRNTVLKYAIFFSSIPISVTNYVVTGSQFGVLLSFLVLSSLVMLLQKKRRGCLLIFVFLTFVLATSHTASSVLLTAFLFAIAAIPRIPYLRLKSFFNFQTALMPTIICVEWLTVRATPALIAILSILFIGVPAGQGTPGGFIPPRFFELVRVDLLEAIKAALVYDGGDLLILLLTVWGLMILLRMRRNIDHTSRFLLFVCGLMLLFIPLGLLLKVGGFRILHLASPLFPVFCAVFIIRTVRQKTWIRALVVFSLAVLATLQLYACQPLIPSANVLSKDLPTNEPIVYVNHVNSIYQRQMINFAESYVDGRISCDGLTENQITGLTRLDFSVAHLTRYYPLDKNQPVRTYDCFLIHLPGISGVFAEQVEMRTRVLLIETMYNSSIVYTNGESYVLANKPPLNVLLAYQPQP